MQEIAIYAGVNLFLSMMLLVARGHRLRHQHWMFSMATICGQSALAWEGATVLAGARLPFAETVGIFLAAGVIVIRCFPSWNAIAHATFNAVTLAAITFLSYAGFVIINADLGTWSLLISLVFLLLQIGTLTLFAAHTFEILDVVCRTRWSPQPTVLPGYTPKVSLHVPTYNEPPELVIETLNALAKLDYPDFEVIVVDNNTADEKLWRPVQYRCSQLGPHFRFFHLLPWEGYKAGALNYALSQTAKDAEIIGIVDADYVVESNYLADLVGFFTDQRIAFVQTPQDYRDMAQTGRYGRALYLAYQYFFKVSMVSRNEHNAIIYAGTMGLIRRSALEQVGGWDEWCITEDAEVSLRLLADGYQSVYIDRSYGHGLMPLDYAGLRKQRFRWAFGGMQILRKHFKLLVNPWSSRKLTFAQRFAYLSGGLQWLNDPLTLAFTAVLLFGAGSLFLGGSFYFQPLVGATMLMPPLFILFALVKFMWAFRVTTGRRLPAVIDALVVMLGLTWVVALACAEGLTRKKGVFLRTPKQKSRAQGMREALRLVLSELILAIGCSLLATVIASSPSFKAFSAQGFIILLLLWQTFIFGNAVRTSLWSYVGNRPVRRAIWPASYRAPGHSRAWLIAERRPALWVGFASLVLLILFYIASRSAPVGERILRSHPLRLVLHAASLLRPNAEELAASTLVREADAAVNSDVEKALSLWQPDGVIVDHNFTPDMDADDRVWRGIQEVRKRYAMEFRERTYFTIRHENLRINIRGDTAIIFNDLKAALKDNKGLEHVDLTNTDRWVLRRGKDGKWRIVELDVNLAQGREAGMMRGSFH